MKDIKLVDIDLDLDVFVDEYLDDDMVEFESILTEKEFETLREYVIQVRDEGRYFKSEIYSEVKTVRFGVVSHRSEDNKIQVRGSLVLESYDQKDEQSRYTDDYNRKLETELIKTRAQYENLLTMLVEKNILNKEEVAKIDKVSSKEIIARDFDYRTF